MLKSPVVKPTAQSGIGAAFGPPVKPQSKTTAGGGSHAPKVRSQANSNFGGAHVPAVKPLAKTGMGNTNSRQSSPNQPQASAGPSPQLSNPCPRPQPAAAAMPQKSRALQSPHWVLLRLRRCGKARSQASAGGPTPHKSNELPNPRLATAHPPRPVPCRGSKSRQRPEWAMRTRRLSDRCRKPRSVQAMTRSCAPAVKSKPARARRTARPGHTG